ncbi:MAG: hypothetical protein JJU00_07825 [Opitutales bacterium]|nr:hypothetical protein [Opitutales bacterium]
MEIKNHILVALLLSAALALPVLSAGSLPDKISSYAKENLVLTVTPAKPLGSAGEMREHILRTAINREWNVVDDDREKNLVVINLVHRRNDSTLYIVYDAERARYYSDSWRLNRRGDRVRRDEPTGWLGNLEGDLKRSINEAALGL